MENKVEFFTKEYFALCSGFTPNQILEFLENYRKLFEKVPVHERSRFVCLETDPDLLYTFKLKAKLEGHCFKTKIKELMREWVDRKNN